MSKFVKALEQAEQERALREQALQHAMSGGIAPAPPAPTREGPAPMPQAAREISAESLARVEEHLVSLLAPTSFGAEQYRTLRHRVEQLHKTANLSIVGVSSPDAGDGKTTTTVNLGGALAQAAEARVLVVDVDLRQPSITDCLGLDGSRGPGLVGAILDDRLSLKDVVEPCLPFNLSIVRAGHQPSAPYELLKSPRLGQLLEEARQHYDYVVLDMPPLVPLPDCRLIARWVDGFLVVVAANKTPRKLLGEALSVLDQTAVIGLIFNGDDRPLSGYYGYYDRSGRYSGTDRAGWGRRGLRRRGHSALEGTR